MSPYPSPRYQVYLLRCWEERSVYPNQPGVWRFSLEDTRTGQRHGFASLEAMVVCLQTELTNNKDEHVSDQDANS